MCYIESGGVLNIFCAAVSWALNRTCIIRQAQVALLLSVGTLSYFSFIEVAEVSNSILVRLPSITITSEVLVSHFKK